MCEHTVVSQTPQKWRSEEVWSIFIILAVGKWRIGIWWKSCMEAAYLQCLPMWSDTGHIVPQRNSGWPQTFVIVDHIVFLKLLSWDQIDICPNQFKLFNKKKKYLYGSIYFIFYFVYVLCRLIQWDIAFRIYMIYQKYNEL